LDFLSELNLDYLGGLNPIVALVFITMVVIGIVLRTFVFKPIQKEEKDEIPLPSVAAGSVGVAAETPKSDVFITPKGKYAAMVLSFRDQMLKPCQINKPCGRQLYFDPSNAKSGWKYFIREDKDGNAEDYEPRNEPLVSEETPPRAWFAVHWEVVGEWFAFSYSIWQDMKTWLVAGLVLFTFIIVLVTIG